VGAALFLSHETVELHLGRTYRKLSQAAELGRRPNRRRSRPAVGRRERAEVIARRDRAHLPPVDEDRSYSRDDDEELQGSP